MLHLACMSGSCDTVLCLLEHECLVDIQNKFGQTPLHLCSRLKFHEVVQLLVENWGADTEIEDMVNIVFFHRFKL